ncbi:S1 RNA-binding domain-containing protein [bacterium]|nr:S1 RNA-binding domain-containing protein [bacterium]
MVADLKKNKSVGVLDSQFGEDDITLEDIYSMMDSFKEGDVIKGVVVKVDKRDIFVDIGYKSEGVIQKSDFRDSDELTVGSEIEVFIETLEDAEGHLVLSKSRAEKLTSWDRTIRAFEEGDVVDGKVIRKTKGGLIVDVGMDAFLPASQIDVKPISDIDAHIGKKYKFKIVKINLKRKNVIVSRREFLENSVLKIVRLF